MQIYVGTKWEAKDIASHAMGVLRRAGHEITHDWTAVEQDGTGSAAHAIADVEGVETADVFVCIPLPDCKGTWVEFGIAVACLIPIIVVGEEYAWKCIFEHLPRVTHVATIEDALAVLDAWDHPRNPVYVDEGFGDESYDE